MVQFKVDDIVVMCASLNDFCGTYSNAYEVRDINISLPPCSINIFTPDCLNFSGINIRFGWTTQSTDPSLNTCPTTLKILGSATTNAQGVASLQYKITQQDLDLYNANSSSFDLAACITNSPIDVDNGIRRAFRPGDAIIIGQNPCLGVTCPDKCYGSDLWSMKCDLLTGACVQDVLKQAALCSGGSQYIEYDFSFLPQSFLDLIASNIVDLSNWLGTHLPIPSNIQWMGATYSGGRFGIYVIYIPPSSVTSLALPAMALSTFAGLIAGLIVFAVAQRLTSVLGPLYSTIIGAALGIVGGLTLSYTIYDFSSGTSAPGTAPPQTSADKSKNIDEYIKNYVKPFCDQQYPGCATIPATCDQATYRVYVACVQQVAQCQYDAALKGDPITTCDPRVQEYKTIDTGLADGTMTVDEAQQRTTTNNTTINNYHDDVVQTMTCPSGQDYDPTTQKCIATAGDCWIPGFTPGSCMLTAKTGKTIAIIGGVAVGGYLLFTLIKK